MPARQRNAVAGPSRGGRRPVPARGSERVDKEDDDEEGEDAGEDDDARADDDKDTDLTGLTVDTFVDRAVVHNAAVERKLTADLTHIKEQLNALHDAAQAITETAVALAEGVEGDIEDDELFRSLDTTLKSTLDQHTILTIQRDTLQTMLAESKTNAGALDVVGRWGAMVRRKREEYEARSERGRYGKTKAYTTFREQLWETTHDTPCPPMSEFLRGDDADSDDEIEIGGTRAEYKCPITLQALVDAQTSEKCGHSYSGDAIRDHIKANRGKANCPVAGCDAILFLTDLKPDRNLQKRSDDAKRRLQEREEARAEADDAELIE